MHELFGDAVIYIDPKKYDYRLKNILKNTSDKGEEVLSRFSWERSARELREILRGMVRL